MDLAPDWAYKACVTYTIAERGVRHHDLRNQTGNEGFDLADCSYNTLAFKRGLHVACTPTQQALWEYDNVVKTEHILNYVRAMCRRR